MTNEDYEYIKQYKDTYNKAYHNNYAHILPRSVNEKLNDIIGGEKKNWGCSVCCMTLYRKLYTILKNEEARRQQIKERMEKARKAKEEKNNKENNTEENGKQEKEP